LLRECHFSPRLFFLARLSHNINYIWVIIISHLPNSLSSFFSSPPSNTILRGILCFLYCINFFLPINLHRQQNKGKLNKCNGIRKRKLLGVIHSLVFTSSVPSIFQKTTLESAFFKKKRGGRETERKENGKLSPAAFKKCFEFVCRLNYTDKSPRLKHSSHLNSCCKISNQLYMPYLSPSKHKRTSYLSGNSLWGTENPPFHWDSAA
jgi:hypothetical protein